MFITIKISSNHILMFFFVAVVFLTKLLTLDILFSTVVTAVVVAKLAILGILFLPSFILALRAVVLTKLVVLSISFSS